MIAKPGPSPSANASVGGATAAADAIAGSPEIHASALIDPGASIGAGTRIWHFCHVMGEARIGIDCVLGQNVFVGRQVVIGDRVHIQNNVSVYEGVILEDEVFCGPSMVFTNVRVPRVGFVRKHTAQHLVTRVRRGASIGANATIVCGVELGQRAMIGAGAVVTRDVAPQALMVGVPARQIGWVCECGFQLSEQRSAVYACPECARRYQLAAGKLTVSSA